MVVKQFQEPNSEIAIEEFDELNDFTEMIEYFSMNANIQDIIKARDKLEEIYRNKLDNNDFKILEEEEEIECDDEDFEENYEEIEETEE